MGKAISMIPQIIVNAATSLPKAVCGYWQINNEKRAKLWCSYTYRVTIAYGRECQNRKPHRIKYRLIRTNDIVVIVPKRWIIIKSTFFSQSRQSDEPSPVGSVEKAASLFGKIQSCPASNSASGACVHFKKYFWVSLSSVTHAISKHINITRACNERARDVKISCGLL